MNKKKYHVFFRRVSTKGQDLSIQIQADAPIREKLLPEETLIVNEDAVSANRVQMADRKELLEVISLIKQEEVDTIYTFDQSRLFRDAYEGNSFNDLKKKYGFKVFFTKDNQLMSDNFLFAGMSVLMSDPNMDKEQKLHSQYGQITEKINIKGEMYNGRFRDFNSAGYGQDSKSITCNSL